MRSAYTQTIADAIPGLTLKQYNQIEDIMRHDIFHSTLDWQTREQLQDAAKLAWEVMQCAA